MNRQNALCALWMLSRAPVWSRVFARLLPAYGSPQNVFAACLAGETDPTIFTEEERTLFSDTDTQKAQEKLKRCERDGIDVVAYGDDNYPASLKDLADPPVALFVRGKLPDTEHAPCLTVVGTRDGSERGRRVAAKLSYSLAKQGFIIVSGLALGIDSYAHKGALMAQNAPTVGVLAGPIDDIYPKENRPLADAIIASGGAVISEIAPGERLFKWAFVQRNRVLAALSPCTVVVESRLSGGSMITADHARKQGKLLLAVPGRSDDPLCEGTNKLIADGAEVCGSTNDVLALYRQRFPHLTPQNTAEKRVKATKTRARKAAVKKTVTDALPEPEKSVYDALGDGAAPDSLCAALGLPVYEIFTALQALELKGLVKQQPGGLYTRK